MILKLVLKSLRREKIRFATAVFGVAAATGLVVWSLGLTMTFAAQSRVTVRRMTEPYDCWVSSDGAGARNNRRPAPAGKRHMSRERVPVFSPETVAAIRSIPGVAHVAACKVIATTLDYRPDGRILQGPPLRGTLMLAEKTGCPYKQAKVTGQWPDPTNEEPVAAVCTAVFESRHLAAPPIGSPLVLMTPSGTVTVKVVAIVDFPQTVAGFPTVFASLGAMRQAADGVFEPSPNLLLCSLNANAALAPIKKVIDATAAENPPDVVSRREIEAQFASDKIKSFKRQAPLLLTLSVLTALCILVNALLVGVEQKLRVLALLRALGMTTRQVARVVMLEGALISVCGWAVGMFGGWAFIKLFVRRMAETFPEGVAMGWVTPASTAVGVAVITALGLFWPCRRAMRIRPLDALEEHSGAANTPKRRTVFRSPWLGFAMLFPMLVLVLPLPISALTRSVLLLTVGIPLHMAGLLLFLPFFVRLVEQLTIPALSSVLRLDARLLRQQISREMARTAGMVLTLAVGLGSYTAIHIWGASMMQPFVPSHTFPDAIVSILPNGIPANEAQKVAALEGIADGRCLPIEAVQVPLTDEWVEKTKQRRGTPPPFPNVLLFGVEPQAAYGGETPLARFRFTAGERQAAADALTQGRACIITRMFSRESGLVMGDTLTLKAGGESTSDVGTPAAFRIAGVVDINWHLLTSRAQLRGRDGMPTGTMGPVFVSEADARRLSGNRNQTRFLWLNLSEAYRAQGALLAGQRLEKDLRKLLQIGTENTVRVHHRDEIEDGTVSHGAQLIGDMARIPFWSLVVLSTGIISLLIASFHASAKTFAVMRAVGMTSGQMFRLLLGEAILTGFCGVLLSLVSGFCIGWTFTGWTRAWMPFGGLPLSLSIPWLRILQGVSFAFALCVIMAVPPIIWLVRRGAWKPQADA